MPKKKRNKKEKNTTREPTQQDIMRILHEVTEKEEKERDDKRLKEVGYSPSIFFWLQQKQKAEYFKQKRIQKKEKLKRKQEITQQLLLAKLAKEQPEEIRPSKKTNKRVRFSDDTW